MLHDILVKLWGGIHKAIISCSTETPFLSEMACSVCFSNTQQPYTTKTTRHNYISLAELLQSVQPSLFEMHFGMDQFSCKKNCEVLKNTSMYGRHHYDTFKERHLQQHICLYCHTWLRSVLADCEDNIITPQTSPEILSQSKTCLYCGTYKDHSTVCAGRKAEIILKLEIKFTNHYLDTQTKCQSPKEMENVKESTGVPSTVETSCFY